MRKPRSVVAVALLSLLAVGAAAAAPAPPAAKPAPPAANSAPPAAKPAPAPAAPSGDAKPADATGNRVVTTEPIHAIVLPMKGSYEQHQAAFERLMGYVAGKGTAPAGSLFARYLSDPAAGEAQLAWEVGVPVAAGVTAEAPFEVRDVPSQLAAVHVHRGSYDELAAAWPEFIQWILANGYQPSGTPMQLFVGDFSAPNVEMRMPVQK